MNKILRKLDLSHSHLGMQGGFIIAELLLANRGLRYNIYLYIYT